MKLGDMSAAEVERPVLEVTDAEVDKTLEILRKQRVRYEAKSTVVQPRKTVWSLISSARRTASCSRAGQASDYPFVLGQGMMLADFETAVEGLKAGESKTFEMTSPGKTISPRNWLARRSASRSPSRRSGPDHA